MIYVLVYITVGAINSYLLQSTEHYKIGKQQILNDFRYNHYEFYSRYNLGVIIDFISFLMMSLLWLFAVSRFFRGK